MYCPQRIDQNNCTIDADFAEKFEELIESYNLGSRNIEELFDPLRILVGKHKVKA